MLEARKDGTKVSNRDLKGAAERLNAATCKYEALQKDLVAQVGEGGSGGKGIRGVRVMGWGQGWLARRAEGCIMHECQL